MDSFFSPLFTVKRETGIFFFQSEYVYPILKKIRVSDQYFAFWTSAFNPFGWIVFLSPLKKGADFLFPQNRSTLIPTAAYLAEFQGLAVLPFHLPAVIFGMRDQSPVKCILCICWEAEPQQVKKYPPDKDHLKSCLSPFRFNSSVSRRENGDKTKSSTSFIRVLRLTWRRWGHHKGVQLDRAAR